MREPPDLGVAGPDRFRLDGRVALVTGAGGAFGREISLGLARAGAAVFATDLDGSRAAATAAAVEAEGGHAASLAGDVGLEADVEAVFAALDARFGRIDVLVNNAGVNPSQGMPERFPISIWESVLRTNLTGMLLFAQGAARRMIEAGAGGSIVNMSSTAGSSVLGRGNLAYGVSKSGVIQMTRELAVEWARYDIRVNAIQPCQFLNEGWRTNLADPAKDELVERVVSGIPLGRMGEPDEVVGPVLFLASPAASMVTGITLPVDGGNLVFNPGGTFSPA
jgi:NAD(P)-dependent dehydrogenase (short-subunit alcohol dehydrogenase family)